MNNLLLISELSGMSVEVYLILIVIAVLTFFFWRWIFKKYIIVARTRRIATWITTIIVTPIIYFLIFTLWIFSVTYYPSHNFDREKWFADKEKRYEISQDLIESKILIGKTKAEVRQLLGESEYAYENDYWGYNLGYRPRFFKIDPDYLDIEFKDGKVINVGQHET